VHANGWVIFLAVSTWAKELMETTAKTIMLGTNLLILSFLNGAIVD
jgi:hypothetical protein